MLFGITPLGILALDVARIEAGLMLLLDVDYVSARKALIECHTSSPDELDLGWTVHLCKDHFVGKEALAREAERAPEWQLRWRPSPLGLARKPGMARWALRCNCRTPHGA